MSDREFMVIQGNEELYRGESLEEIAEFAVEKSGLRELDLNDGGWI